MTQHTAKRVRLSISLPCGCRRDLDVFKTSRVADAAQYFKSDFDHDCAAHRHLPDWKMSLPGYVTAQMFSKLEQLDLLAEVTE